MIYMCEFGIAEDVQKVCGVNKRIPKVREGACQTRQVPLEQQKLSKSLKYMDDFCCQRDLSDILTDTMKSKTLMVETQSCTDPVWALYYRMQEYVLVWGFI